MIRTFLASEKIFTGNGEHILRPLKASVTKADNAEFGLEIELPLDQAGLVAPDQIIVAPTPQGDQAFRVDTVSATRRKISITARHIYYDAQKLVIQDSYVVDKGCAAALEHLNLATDTQSPFTTGSDISVIESFRCVRKTLAEAVDTVLERWGGHLVRDNWNIRVDSSIGADNGVVVRYAKNLESITVEEDWRGVVTKVLPVGKDGLLLNAIDSAASVFVESPITYDIPHTATEHFTQDHIAEEDFRTANGDLDEQAYKTALAEDLMVQATAWLEERAQPVITYTLAAHLDRVTDIGDIIHVTDERLGVDITTNLIAFTYDCIAGRYTQLEFGTRQKTVSGLLETVSATSRAAAQAASETTRATLTTRLDNATNRIWQALNGSNVIYDGDKILVVDQLPPENAHNVMMINSAGIGFSTTGINGTFNSAWLIDGTLDMQQINVINLSAEMIRGGVLRLGNLNNQSGVLELYDNNGALLGLMDRDGLKMYGADGSWVQLNNAIGFAGFDATGTKTYWADGQEFHMRKAVVEEEITLCGQLRFIDIIIPGQNEGIGLVSAYTG